MKLCPACKNGLPGLPARCPVCSQDLSSIEKVGEDGLTGMTIADGRYELVELLGEGGMAWVYRGVHKGLERDVAVKLLKSAPAEIAREQSKRFEREARLSSRLNHPHILSIIDFGRTPAGLMYLVTEYVKGRPLNQVLWEDRPLPLARVVDIFHQVLAAVDEAHGAGVIHRDIKPENIIVNQLRSGEDFVKVLDFGIAVLAGRPEGKVTQAGAFIGTPGFMSPEQIAGEEATERSDVYALGAMLYEMLAGRAAFENDSPIAVMTMQLDGVVVPLSQVAPERGLLPELDEVVTRAMARDPRERYASVGELRDGVLGAVLRMSRIELDCSSCSRPVDPATGLCRLHRGGASSQRMQARAPAVTADLPPPEQIVFRSRVPAPVRVEAARFGVEGVVGREAAHAEVASFVEGSEVLLLVTGSEGAGKTTLARGIERVGAEDLKLTVLRTGPDPARSLTPWFPVRELVGEVLGCGPSPGSPTLYGEAAAASGFSEADEIGLHLLFGFEVPGSSWETPARRNAIHAAATRALMSAGGGRGGPWLIAEDAHAYDAVSLDFFRALGALAVGTGLKVVITAARDLGGWAGASRHLGLRPLAPESCAELVETLFIAAPDALRQRVLTAVAASGMPGHAVEAKRLLEEDGDPMGSFDDVLAERVGRLSPTARRSLQAESMLGSEVETSLARAALRSMSADDRRRLAGELLSSALDAGGSVFLLARLADEAGQTERAVELLERAGDEAVRLDDTVDAGLVHYRRAAHLVRWALLMSEEDELYLRISLKMGRALAASGHRKAAEVVYKEIIAAARRHPSIAERARQELGTLSGN